MFIGHAFLALALGLLVGRLAGFSDRSVLVLGLVAAGSAVLPDLDLLVSLGSVAGVLTDSMIGSWEGYWSVSNQIHRDVSHTLIGGTGTALALAGAAVWVRAFAAGQRGRMGGGIGIGLLGIFLPLLLLGSSVDAVGWIGFSFVLIGAIVFGAFVASRTDLGTNAILGGALLGQWLHPFTDIFLGQPPAMFYPFESQILAESVVLASDPTISLLGVTMAELTAVWIGVIAISRVQGYKVRALINRFAAIGVAFPLVMLALPRPTMADAHWLGFPLAPFGLAGLAPLLTEGRSQPDWILRSVTTGLASITLATVSYGLALLVGIT